MKDPIEKLLSSQNENRILLNQMISLVWKKKQTCSQDTSNGAVFAQKFMRTIRHLMKKVVYEKENASWIDEIDSIIYNLLMQHIRQSKWHHLKHFQSRN